MNTLDPDLLKTFLAFVDGGSLARAAIAVGRSPSAVTAQMHRLEEMVGEPLLAPQGRGRGLTLTGEELVGHARRILAAHRDAWLGLKGARAEGRVSVGTTQDFAESGMPDLLRDFARAHPWVRLELRIGRSAELSQAFQDGALDLAIAMRRQPMTDEIKVVSEPMVWAVAAKGLAVRRDELPLALLDPPCSFREAALAALDAAERPYRIAATSASLAGLRAAVEAGPRAGHARASPKRRTSWACRRCRWPNSRSDCVREGRVARRTSGISLPGACRSPDTKKKSRPLRDRLGSR
jgi:DNA-binding transcriptional LysR family regulator